MFACLRESALECVSPGELLHGVCVRVERYVLHGVVVAHDARVQLGPVAQLTDDGGAAEQAVRQDLLPEQQVQQAALPRRRLACRTPHQSRETLNSGG